MPLYYNTSNLRGIATALALSKMSNVSFIEENLAVALDYGYYKAQVEKFPAGGSVVLFCDMGKFATTITVVRFTNVGAESVGDEQTSLTVLGSRCELFGGYNFDCAVAEALYRVCCDHFQEEVQRSDSTMFKLRAAAESVKCNLSARGASDVSFTIPNVRHGDEMESDDVEGVFSKEDFESACTREDNLFERFYHVVFAAVEAIAEEATIDVVEVCGSAMRTPRLQEELLKAVQHAGNAVSRVSNTLNMEEACARGCVLFGTLFAEGAVKCSVEEVTVSCDAAEVARVCVYGTKPCEAAAGLFTISANNPLGAGNDHDCMGGAGG